MGSNFQIAHAVGSDISIATQDISALASAGIISVSKTVLSAIPIVGAIASTIISLITMFFHGANPNQVPSAQDEQIYEAASDNAYALAKAGYIDIPTALIINSTLVNLGTTTLQNLQAKIGNLGGLQNLVNTLKAESLGIQSLPIIPLKSFTMDDAHALYVQPSSKGWYISSVEQAAQLTDQILQTYLESSPTGGLMEGTAGTISANTASQAITGNLTALEGSITAYPLYALGALLILILLFRKGIL